jgi:hypothetical protein
MKQSQDNTENMPLVLRVAIGIAVAFIAVPFQIAVWYILVFVGTLAYYIVQALDSVIIFPTFTSKFPSTFFLASVVNTVHVLIYSITVTTAHIKIHIPLLIALTAVMLYTFPDLHSTSILGGVFEGIAQMYIMVLSQFAVFAVFTQFSKMKSETRSTLFAYVTSIVVGALASWLLWPAIS